MTARVALILCVALMLEFAGNALLNGWQDRELISSGQRRQLAEQLVVAKRLVADTPPELRRAIAADLRTDGVLFNWVEGTVIADSSASEDQLSRLKRQLVEMAPQLTAHDIRLVVVAAPSGKRDLIGAMQLADRSFVTFRVSPYLGGPPPFAFIVMLHLALVAVVPGLALLLIRAIVKPLRQLAELADATGVGTPASPVIEGPVEVQRVATAFADMQARLLRIMDEHTQALVAVSHDLRTPIQRLRLRTSLLEDDHMRETMAADLSDIERFIGSVVSFMQGNTVEETRLVDVAALVMTVVDNAADTGAAISYVGPDELNAYVQPLTLKRALANLIENAAKYANTAQVRLSASGGRIALSVEDDGPGIPAEEYDTACLPFRRLDTAEQRGSDGAGLGLAIAKNAAAALSGRLSLDRSRMGGLCASITFPLTSERRD